jgi:hypothetical protein
MRNERSEPDETCAAPACEFSTSAVAFLQGELLSETTARFVRHLDACAACRDEVREAAEIIGRVAALPEPNAEVDLVPRVMLEATRVLSEERVQRARRVRVRGIAAAAALAFVITGLVWWSAAGTREELPRREAVGVALPDSSREVTGQALQWLAHAQELSGAWSARRWGGQPLYDIALTSLAVLALLNDADESRPAEGRERSVVRVARERALAHLISAQESDGRIGPAFAGALYNHAIAAVALIEAFGCAHEERLRAPIDRALAFIRAQQASGGGWGYLGVTGDEPNTALTCWPLQALLLARALGWQGLDAAIGGGFAHLAHVTDARGRLGYRRAGDFAYGAETLAPMGALCVLLGGDAAPVPGNVRGRMLDAIMLAGAGQKKEADLYRDFFLTAALRALPPSRGARVPHDALRALSARQVQGGAERGSWAPRDRWGSVGGRVYATAVATLILTADERAQRLSRWVSRG